MLDTIYFLYQIDKPMRFFEIEQLLKLQGKYRDNFSSIKPLLTKGLKRLIGLGVIEKEKRSHKFVTYRIKNKNLARLLLSSRLSEHYRYTRESSKLFFKQIPVEKLHSKFLLGFAINLIMLESIIWEARVGNFDSFIKWGRSNIIAIYDSFAKNLFESKIDGERKRKLRDFYMRKLKNVRSSVSPQGFRSGKRYVINVNSWVRSFKANHYARLNLWKILKETFEECLSDIRKTLDKIDLSDEELTEKALEILEKISVRNLSEAYGEFKRRNEP